MAMLLAVARLLLSRDLLDDLGVLLVPLVTQRNAVRKAAKLPLLATQNCCAVNQWSSPQRTVRI
jgi:hypothetical protein